MDHAEFKKKLNDPRFTFGFENLRESMRLALGARLYATYQITQTTLSVVCMAVLAWLSCFHGLGNLFWIPLAVFFLHVGKPNPPIIDTLILFLIFQTLYALTMWISAWSGTGNPPYHGLFFTFGCWLYSSVSKSLIMEWMIRRMRADPLAFSAVNERGLVYFFQINFTEHTKR